MTAENCAHGNAAPREVLASLPHSQSGEARHRCAACAYAKGVEAGRRVALAEVEAAVKRLSGTAT